MPLVAAEPAVMAASRKEPTLLITGFGPFGSYSRNPSWEVAKSVEVDGVNIVREYLPVEYEEVEKRVPDLWKKYQPDLVIHCGVSGIAVGLTIEKVAACGLYTREDVKGKRRQVSVSLPCKHSPLSNASFTSVTHMVP